MEEQRPNMKRVACRRGVPRVARMPPRDRLLRARCPALARRRRGACPPHPSACVRASVRCPATGRSRSPAPPLQRSN